MLLSLRKVHVLVEDFLKVCFLDEFLGLFSLLRLKFSDLMSRFLLSVLVNLLCESQVGGWLGFFATFEGLVTLFVTAAVLSFSHFKVD